MFLVILLYTLFAAASIWKLVVGLKPPKDFPPGPYLPLPLLRWTPGSKYYKMPYTDIFKQLYEEHRGPFSVHLGHKRVVLLTDLDSVRTVYAKDFTQRPEEVVSEWRENRFGIIFSNDQDWQEQRKMFVSTLAKTGFKRGRLQKTIDSLWTRMSSAVESKICLGATAEIDPEDFNLCMMDFVFSMVCDPNVMAKDGCAGEETPDKAIKNIDHDRQLGIQWCESKLWYRYGLARFLAPNLTGYEDAKSKLQACMNSLERIVKKHYKTSADREEEDQDFIDLYLKKIKSNSNCKIWGGDVGMKRLMGALDTIPLGGDGLFMAFNCAIFCLARYPEQQKKLREAIAATEHVGEAYDGLRRGGAPYCKAFIMEVLRYVGQGGFGAVRQAKSDIWTQGYRIPKGVDVYPNFMHIMNDEAHWKEPRTFNPERFINSEGNVVNDPHWIPFGVGVRACPGQNFSMDALQAIVAKFVMEYELDFAGFTTKQKVGEDEETEMVGMGLYKPRNYTVTVRKASPLVA